MGPLSLAYAFSREEGPGEAREVLVALNKLRNSIEPPQQSNFRVLACLVFEERDKPGTVHSVVGANSEPCCISGSICAERACIVQLRGREPVNLLRIYIVSDSTAQPITPGLLCREFLASLASDDLPIHLADAACGVLETTTIGRLYPHPCIYRYMKRDTLLPFGEDFSRNLSHPSSVSPEAAELYDKALEAVRRDNRHMLHPIAFGAAARFSDGSVITAWQKKGLEYGTTLCAVTQLAQAIECKPRVKLSMIVQVDQLGICHAPFAVGRAYLQEYGHGDAQVVIHVPPEKSVGGTATLVSVCARDLAPALPSIWDLEDIKEDDADVKAT